MNSPEQINKLQRSYDLFNKGDIENAKKICLAVLSENPDYPDANALMGLVAHQEKQFETAIQFHQKAIKLKPNTKEYLCNLGSAYDALGRPLEALAVFNAALKIDPTNPICYFNMHRALQHLNKLDEAISALKVAIKCDPKFIKPYLALTDLYQTQKKFKETEEVLHEAEKIFPDNPDIPFCRAYYLLRVGKLREGYEAIKSRWLKPNIDKQYNRAKYFHIPAWKGENLNNKKLVLWAEQGIGDQIMCASIIPELATKCGELYVEIEDRMQPLFARSFPQIKLLKRTNPPDKKINGIDYHIAFLDLPGWFRSNLNNFPVVENYLKADEKIVTELKNKYDKIAQGKKKIGISWSTIADIHDRPIKLHMWKDIFTTDNTEFFSLQYGNKKEEISQFEQHTGHTLHVDETINSLKDLDRFTAQVAAMDLIISIDNSTAHFAGALGKPVWTLLPALPDWRWMFDRNDSPWYPSMKLFRQTDPGNWLPVLNKVKDELTKYSSQ